MKYAVLMLAGWALALGGCASSRPNTTPDDHAGLARPSVDHVSSMNPQRDIVVAVANPLAPPSTHAGSSLLGYTPSANYGAGQRAISVLASLKKPTVCAKSPAGRSRRCKSIASCCNRRPKRIGMP